MRLSIIYVVFFISVLWQQVGCSNLDGTSSIVYKNQHHVFYNGENAQGFVRLNGGFTIVAGATATLDTVTSVSSSIDLRDTGVLQLLKDLEFDSGLTLSNGGSINGRGSAIILNSKLEVPASKVVSFTGNTVVDGQGNVLLLQEHARLSVSNNVTVTLRNCIIQNTRNSTATPFIALGGSGAKLAFDNVIIAAANDLNITTGQLFFHNSVNFTGTSALVYQSSEPSFVAPQSTLYFDINTTFSFVPGSTDNTLFRLQNNTAELHFNGCSLQATSTGMRLTKGRVLFENKVRVDSNTDSGNQSISNGIVFGNSAVGASENVSVEILGAAHMTIRGIVNDDSV